MSEFQTLRDVSIQFHSQEINCPNTNYPSRCFISKVYPRTIDFSYPLVDAQVQTGLHPVCKKFVTSIYAPLVTRIVARYAPTSAVAINNCVNYIKEGFAVTRTQALQMCSSLYQVLGLPLSPDIIHADDDFKTPAEIVKEVLTNPLTEIRSFLRSIVCSADNAFALVNVSQMNLLDPLTGEKTHPRKILSRALYNFISSFAHRPASDVCGVMAALAGVLAATQGSVSGTIAGVFSSLAMFLNPNTTFPSSTQKAALYNLSQMVTLRQVVRFLMLASLLLFAWKIGGSVFHGFSVLFRMPQVQEHSVGFSSIAVVILGLLTTWLGGHYHTHFILDFLRTSTLLGGANFVCNTLNEALIFVARLLADFIAWIGLRKLTQPLYDFVAKRNLDKYTRKGGMLNELLPRITSFLAARPLGILGPGTVHYVNEGRELIQRIDLCLNDIVAIDGSGHLFSMLARYRQQLSTAIESSLFAMENSTERCEPVFMHFCGGPRMGKTMFVNAFIEALRSKLCAMDERDGHFRHTISQAREHRWVYSRNSDDPFFSGYNKQALIFYDDLFTSNNAPSNTPGGERHEQELSEIQHLVSSQPYAPPMPEVGAGVPCPKGTYIAPAFVVSTSNYMFVNTGARETTIIDDRISHVILVLLDRDKPKDHTFSHLVFKRCLIPMSLLREQQKNNGWYGPFCPTHQFPTTEEEFEEWALKDAFETVKPFELLEIILEKHKTKLVEMHIRRQGALTLGNKGDLNELADLEASFDTISTTYNLRKPPDFRARIFANGIQGALCDCTSLASHKKLVIDPNGPIVISLVKGRFVPEIQEIERLCSCVGGHSSLFLCPDFLKLRINMQFREESDSPVRSLPCFMVADGKIVRTQTPLPLDAPLWRLVTNNLAYACGVNYMSDTLPEKSDEITPVEYEGMVGVRSKDNATVIGIGIHSKMSRHVYYVTNMATIRYTHLNRSFPLRVVEQHAFKFMAQTDYPPLDITWENTLQYFLGKATENDPPPPMDSNYDHAVVCLGEVFRSNNFKLTSEQRELLEKDYFSVAAYRDAMSEPDVQSAFWIQETRARLELACMRLPVTMTHLHSIEENEILLSTPPSNNRKGLFQWRYLAQLLVSSIRMKFESACPVQWTVENYSGERQYRLYLVNIPGAFMMHKIGTKLQPRKVLEFVGRYADDADDHVQSILSLCDFLNTYGGVEQTPWVDRLQENVRKIWDILVRFKQVIFVGLAAFTGAFAVTFLGGLARSLLKERKQVDKHSFPYHRLLIRESNSWPEKYKEFLRTVWHPNSARKERHCPLCSNMNRPTHSNCDVTKETTLIKRIIDSNSSHPDLKPYLLGIMTFNNECISLLQNDDEQSVRSRLLLLSDNDMVPFSASGKHRHLYVYRAWQCKKTRVMMLQCLREQNAIIIARIGNYSGKPKYRAELNFPVSCKIPSERVDCCQTVEQCQCDHVQEHAYYLPNEPVKQTAVETVVATAVSGCGFILANGMVVGRGTIIADGVLITAYHVVSNYVNTGVELGWRGQTRFNFYITNENIVLHANTDIALVKVKSDELPAVKIGDILMSAPPLPGTKISIVKLDTDMRKTLITANVLSGKTATTSCTNTFFVDKRLDFGDSGSLVVQGGRIVGHYYGAYGDQGCICHWPAAIARTVKQLARSDMYDSRFIQEVDEHGFAIIDYFDTKQYDSNPPTAERPTELKEAFEQIGINSVKAPASLSQEALAKSIYKWEPVDENFDSDYAKAAEELRDFWTQHIIDENNGMCDEFKTWDDCLNGCEEGQNRMLKKVDMSTSAGAPWCDIGVSKTDLIDDTRDRLKCKPAFCEILDQVHAKFSQGDVAGYTATANSKDELRDLERVALKKTRLFCATPLHHNMMFRKYYGRWIHAFKALPFDKGMHAMGTDVFGSDWNDLYDYLMSAPHGPGFDPQPVFLAGDFSRFDTSHSGWKLAKAFTVASGACTNQRMCDILARSICRFGLRFNDREFKVPAGLPSGCQMTTPINCVLNTLIWVTVWKKLTGGDLQHFMKHARLIVYGDDVVLGLDKNSPLFSRMNPKKIQECMAALGYTFESNDDQPLRWQKLHEVTFLKRRFVFDILLHQVHAPRPIDEIYTQLMWRKHEPNVEAQACCFRAFAYEAGQHPESVYNEMIMNLQRALKIANSRVLNDAFALVNMRKLARKAHKKELELEDLLQLRTMFWKLW